MPGELILSLPSSSSPSMFSDTLGGSVADLRSKKKGSLSSLSKIKGNVGGSLMNIGSKQTGIKKFTDSGDFQ